MIIETTETLDGRTFRVTRSDAGFMIENEAGERYSEAWDLPTVSHTYTETTEPIEPVDPEDEAAQYEAAGRLLLGGE